MEKPKENLDAVKSEILNILGQNLKEGKISNIEDVFNAVKQELMEKDISGIDYLEFMDGVLDGAKNLFMEYRDKAKQIKGAEQVAEETKEEIDQKSEVILGNSKELEEAKPSAAEPEIEEEESEVSKELRGAGHRIEDFISILKYDYTREDLKNRKKDVKYYYDKICACEEDIKNLDIPKDSNELIVKRKELIDEINDFRENYLGIDEIKFKEPSELVLEELKEENVDVANELDDLKKSVIKDIESELRDGESDFFNEAISLDELNAKFAELEKRFSSKKQKEKIEERRMAIINKKKEAQSKMEKVNADLGEENLQGNENGLKGASDLEGNEVKKKGEKAVLEKAEDLKQSLLNNEITQLEFNREINGIIRKNNMSEDLKEKLSRVKKEAMDEWKEKNPRKLVQNGKNVVQEPGKEPKIEEEIPKTHLGEVEEEISDLIKNCESKEECLYKLDGVKKREDSLLSVLGREAEGSQEQKRVVVSIIDSIENIKADRSGKWTKEKKEEEEEQMRLQRLIDQDNAKEQAGKEEKKYPLAAIPKHPLVKPGEKQKSTESEIVINLDEKFPLSRTSEGKAETLEQAKERKKAFEGAVQAVVEAEARLKKAEKNQRRYGAIISAFNFRKKTEGEADNELLAAQKNLQEANRKYKDLTRQYMEDAFQDQSVEAAEQKFNAIQAKMDAGILLEDKRMEAQEKGGEGLVGEIQLALRKYHKLPFKTHLKIMGGIILVSGIAPLALSAALSGTVLTTVLVLNRILSTVGGMATAESMIDNRLKKRREKKGQTLESQRSLAEGYVLEGTEGIDINTMEGKLAFLNKASGDADSEIARRMSEIKEIEHKQNIGKWLAVAGVGAFFALGGPEKIFRFGKEKLFGKAPEAPPVKKPIGSGAGKLEAPLADSNAPAPKFSKKMPGGVGSKSAEDLVKDFTEKEMAKEAEFLRTYKGVSKSTQGALSGTVAEKATEKGAEKIAGKAVEAISKISPEKLIETAKPGDSIWKMLENKSSELFGKEEWYKNMDKIQKIHFTDTLKRKMLEGRPSEFLKVGETVDLSKAFGGDGSIIKNLAKKYVEGGDIIKGGAKYENIEKVSGVIKNNINGWTRAKGSPLTTSEISQKVRDALGGIGGKISKKAGEKISGDIPAVPRWKGLGPRPEAMTTMADSSAYGRIENAAERIIKENLESLKNSLSSVKQSELDIVGHGDAKTFLTKKASPSWAGIDINDHGGTKAFKNIWKAANEANLSGVADKPKIGESISDWMARNGKKVGVELKPKKFFDKMSEKIGRMGSF